jgi:hypothetical protein
MGEPEHKCQGCKSTHLAALWYHREGERDMEHWQEWLCGVKYGDLSDHDKNRWKLWDPQWGHTS